MPGPPLNRSTNFTMAGYHYKLEIVPKSFLSVTEGKENYWEAEQPKQMMLAEFRKLLPKDNSWGETEEYRCDKNRSVLYIWWDNQKVWSIQLEYAPVLQGKDILLNSIIDLCRQFGYNLYSEESKRIVIPSKSELWQDFIQCSRFQIYKQQGLAEFG